MKKALDAVQGNMVTFWGLFFSSHSPTPQIDKHETYSVHRIPSITDFMLIYRAVSLTDDPSLQNDHYFPQENPKQAKIVINMTVTSTFHLLH